MSVFFSLSLYFGLVFPIPLVLLSLGALSRLSRTWAVSIPWSGNGTGTHHAPCPPQARHKFASKFRFVFRQLAGCDFIYFPNWEFFQNELIQFFHFNFFLLCPTPLPRFHAQV